MSFFRREIRKQTVVTSEGGQEFPGGGIGRQGPLPLRRICSCVPGIGWCLSSFLYSHFPFLCALWLEGIIASRMNEKQNQTHPSGDFVATPCHWLPVRNGLMLPVKGRGTRMSRLSNNKMINKGWQGIHSAVTTAWEEQKREKENPQIGAASSRLEVRFLWLHVCLPGWGDL